MLYGLFHISTPYVLKVIFSVSRYHNNKFIDNLIPYYFRG